MTGAELLSGIVESARELRAKFVEGIEGPIVMTRETVWNEVQRTTSTNSYYWGIVAKVPALNTRTLVHIGTGTILGSWFYFLL